MFITIFTLKKINLKHYITDYTLIKQYVLKGLTNLSTQQIMVSDLNGDGKVDVNDTNILKQIIVKFLKCCPLDTNQDGFINEKNNIKYAGYFYDGETGLYYLNARFYDPETARFIQEDTYRGGINDPLSLNLYTYSHNNPISYYDPTGHFKIKIGDMLKFAATTAKVVAKAVVIPKAKKTAKTLKEDWQSGVDELKKGGVVSQRFAGFSKGVVGAAVNQVNTIKYIGENPKEAIGGIVFEWLDTVSKNPQLADPIDYFMYQTAKGVYTEGKSLVKNVKEKDWDAISYKAGSGCFLMAESGVASYASKAVFTKFKSPVGSKNALLDEPSINTSNFNFSKSTNPIKSKFFNNTKETFSRILRDETGSVKLGKNKNVGAGEVNLKSLNPNDINFSQRTVSKNVNDYVADMKAGNWDWERSGPLRVMERDGNLVSYDNRRLMAAQQAGLDSVPVQFVKPTDIHPEISGTWENAFLKRLNHQWNIKAGGVVPNSGISSQPEIFSPKRR